MNHVIFGRSKYDDDRLGLRTELEKCKAKEPFCGAGSRMDSSGSGVPVFKEN